MPDCRYLYTWQRTWPDHSHAHFQRQGWRSADRAPLSHDRRPGDKNWRWTMTAALGGDLPPATHGDIFERLFDAPD